MDVLEFTCRAALIAASAAAVLWLLRVRGPAAQHAVWTGVLCAMLALPLWMAWGPKAALPILPAVPEIAAQPLPAPAAAAPPSIPAPPPPTPHRDWSWRDVALAVYLVGAATLLARLAAGTLRSFRLAPEACTAPITVGFLRPRILLPAASASWTPAQLAAVLTHERAHARRRDPLVQWLALLNRALFWFHPVAWWLERRLASLAEDVCDAAVLADGHSPTEYAAFLIELARHVSRIHAIGTAMPGSDLPRRIRRIARGIAPPPVSKTKLAIAAAACALCTAACAALTLDQATLPLAPAPVAFDVVSIRPCKPGDFTPAGKKGGRGGSGPFRASGGSLTAECQTVENLIRWAYLGYPDGKPWPVDKALGLPMPPPNPVFRQDFHGPSWIASDRYTIRATAPKPQPIEMMRGPMMRAILEQRFHLKVRIEERDTAVYILTRGGGDLKLQRTAPGGCLSFEEWDRRYGSAPRQPGAFAAPPCGAFRPTIYDRDPNADRDVAARSIGVDTRGATMDSLCTQFTVGTGRQVLNRTGLAGQYDIHLDLADEDLFGGPRQAAIDAGEPPQSPEDRAAHIAAAVQKLGLKLEPGKTKSPFLVIEKIDRPTEN
jgi:uncharacterized protein (TIGR03435 family)